MRGARRGSALCVVAVAVAVVAVAVVGVGAAPAGHLHEQFARLESDISNAHLSQQEREVALGNLAAMKEDVHKLHHTHSAASKQQLRSAVRLRAKALKTIVHPDAQAALGQDIAPQALQERVVQDLKDVKETIASADVAEGTRRELFASLRQVVRDLEEPHLSPDAKADVFAQLEAIRQRASGDRQEAAEDNDNDFVLESQGSKGVLLAAADSDGDADFRLEEEEGEGEREKGSNGDRHLADDSEADFRLEEEEAGGEAADVGASAARDVEVEQYFHAGSDLELLRGRLVADGNMGEDDKARYDQNLQRMEDALAQLSARELPAVQKKALVRQLRDGEDVVREMTAALSAAQPDLSDHAALESAKHVLARVSSDLHGHLSQADQDNLANLAVDLEMLERSNDAQQNADLVQAIKLRMPAVQSLATQIHRADAHTTPAVADLEKEVVGEGESAQRMTHKQHTDKGLKALEQAEAGLAVAKLPAGKKAKYNTALKSIRADFKLLRTASGAQRDAISRRLENALPTIKAIREDLVKLSRPPSDMDLEEDYDNDNNDNDGDASDDKEANNEGDVDAAPHELSEDELADTAQYDKFDQEDYEQEAAETKVTAEDALPLVEEEDKDKEDKEEEHDNENEDEAEEVAEAEDKDNEEEVAEAEDNEEDKDEGQDKDSKAEGSMMEMEKLRDLEKTVKEAGIPDAQKDHFLSNIRGLEKDTEALKNTQLTPEQRNDLESAMKLRITMLKDMEQFLG